MSNSRTLKKPQIKNSEFFKTKNLMRGTKKWQKYFCPDCKNVTFSLRYMTKSTWHTVGLQWCNSCLESKPTNDCFKITELHKNNFSSVTLKKMNFLSKIFQEKLT
jgi:hypothetical protein